MAGITTSFGQLPEKVRLRRLQGVFLTEVKKVRDYLPMLFEMESTDEDTLFWQGFAGLGAVDGTTWDATSGGNWDGEGTIQYRTITTKLESNIQQVFWRNGVSFSWKYRKFQKYGLMQKGVESLARKMRLGRQKYGLNFWNQQLAGSGDYWNTTEAKYLFATDHALNNGSTYGNLITGALSVAKLQEAIYTLEMTPDEDGEPLGIKAKRLWVHPYNKVNAMEILEGLGGGKPQELSNTRNVVEDWNLELLVCEHFAPSATGSFMLQGDYDGTTKCVTSHNFEQSQWYDNTDKSIKHDVVLGFNVGAIDWRNFVGSRG